MPIMLNALHEFRERQGWTLAEISGLTGLSTQYLSLIERHKREPSPTMKVRIARGVGVPLAELFPAQETAKA